MASFWPKQTASRLGKSIVTNIATAQVNASQTTTPFGQTHQVRVASNLAIWIDFGVPATVTATAQSDYWLPANTAEYFCVSQGQALAFCSTSTSTGWVAVAECQ